MTNCNHLENFLKEFTNVTNNEVYSKLFADRIMLKDPKTNILLGNNSRDHFLQFLNPLVQNLNENARIFDIGAGAGDNVDLCFKKQLRYKAVIDIVEPNPFLLEKYLVRIKDNSSLISNTIAYQGPIQDFYTITKKNLPFIPTTNLQLITAVHMIYFITDFKQSNLVPEDDIKNFLKFIYKILDVDGSIFLVYASSESCTQKMSISYFASESIKYPNFYNNLRNILNTRNLLLRDGGIAEYLNSQYPEYSCSLESHTTEGYFYGKSKFDLAAMLMAGEMVESNDEIFDLEKLKFSLHNLEKHPVAFGLQMEMGDVPQKGMWRVNQQQVIAIIKKNKKTNEI